MGIFGSLFNKKKGFESESLPNLAMEPESENGPWGREITPEQDDFNPKMLQSTRAANSAQYEVPEFNPAPRELVSGERFRNTGGISEKDVQLILSKLDLISSRLDNLNRRFEALENSRKKDIW